MMKLRTEPDLTFLPQLTDDEFELLKAGLAANPDTIPPIIVWGNYKDGNVIVDGAHRTRVFEELGIPPKIKAINFENREKAIAFAIRAQLGRRNVSATVKSSLALRLAQLDRLTQQQAADIAGVSLRTVTQAEQVRTSAHSEVNAAVNAGEISIRDAASVAKLPQSKQRSALEKVRAGEATSLSKAVEFDTKKLDKQLKRRQGKEKIPFKLHKELSSTFGRLVRLLDRVALTDDIQVSPALDAIDAAINALLRDDTTAD